jgi:ankyrin repeat protein
VLVGRPAAERVLPIQRRRPRPNSLRERQGPDSPLLQAATVDRLDVARLLVALGADPDAVDDRHDTPWLVTGVTGSVAMLEILLPAEPDRPSSNRFGGTSLIPASERGHRAYIQAAVNTSVDINHVNDLGWTALMEAVLFGNGSADYQDIVNTLLEAGADASIPDGEGTTALQHAQALGHSEIAQLLGG